MNSKNCKRLRILNSICSKFNLIRKEIGHKTYHHFVGKGMSDSELDVLIYKIPSEEQLLKVYCIHENPLMTSHHDALMSCFFLPVVQHTPKIDDLPRAPRVNNQRIRIHWSENGIKNFSDLIGPQLERLRRLWLNSNSKTSTDIMIHSTNDLLNSYAKRTNTYKNLTLTSLKSAPKRPYQLTRSECRLRKSHRLMRSFDISSPSYAAAYRVHQERKRQHLR